MVELKIGDVLLIAVMFIMIVILWIRSGLPWYIPIGALVVGWFSNLIENRIREKFGW